LAAEKRPTIMLSLKEKTVKGVMWLGFNQITYQVLSWACTIFIARILSPSDYGLMTMAMVVVGFVQLFGELGIDNAIIQRPNIDKSEVDSLFWITIISGSAFYLILYLIAPFVSQLFDAHPLTLILRVLGLTFIINSLNIIPYTLLTKELAFDKRSRAEIGANIISSLSTLVLALLGFGIWSLVLGFMGRSVVLFVALSISTRYCPGRISSLSKATSFLRYGLHIVLSRIFWYIYSNADYFVVGKFIGQTALGYYTMAFQLSSMPIDKVAGLVNPVAMASFSQLQDQTEELKSYFLSFSRAISTVVFPALVGLAFISEDFVNVVLTDKWAAAVIPLRVLALMGIFKCLSFVVAPLLNARGKPHIGMQYSAVCAVILPAAFFFGARYGLEGVSLAWLIIFPWLSSFMLYLGCREVRVSFKEYFSNLFPSLVGTLAMLAVLIIVKALLGSHLSGWGILSSYILIGAFIYAGVLLVFFPRVRTDLGTCILRRGAEATTSC
jgi:O-antigen/teichoic acid export membrane protein